MLMLRRGKFTRKKDGQNIHEARLRNCFVRFVPFVYFVFLYLFFYYLFFFSSLIA